MHKLFTTILINYVRCCFETVEEQGLWLNCCHLSGGIRITIRQVFSKLQQQNHVIINTHQFPSSSFRRISLEGRNLQTHTQHAAVLSTRVETHYTEKNPPSNSQINIEQAKITDTLNRRSYLVRRCDEIIQEMNMETKDRETMC